MAHVCPWWFGYVLLLPLRRLRQNPTALLGPLVREGMTVIEPGCGMGFFTLDVARLVGPAGRVVAVDVQQRMLDRLARRARRAGVLERIELRLASHERLGLDDLARRADLALAIYVAHEAPDPCAFVTECAAVVRPAGHLLLAEPKLHVIRAAFEASCAAAARAGLARERDVAFPGSRAVLFGRPERLPA